VATVYNIKYMISK